MTPVCRLNLARPHFSTAGNRIDVVGTGLLQLRICLGYLNIHTIRCTCKEGEVVELEAFAALLPITAELHSQMPPTTEDCGHPATTKPTNQRRVVRNSIVDCHPVMVAAIPCCSTLHLKHLSRVAKGNPSDGISGDSPDTVNVVVVVVGVARRRQYSKWCKVNSSTKLCF